MSTDTPLWRIPGLWFELAVAAACSFCLLVPFPALAQEPRAYGAVGVGISSTSEGSPSGPAIGPGVGGQSAVLAVGGGVWLTRMFAVGVDISAGTSFEVEQVEGGVGRCCSEVTRDHRLTLLSAVVKVQIVPGFALVTSPSLARLHTDERRITTPIGGATQAAVTGELSTHAGAWLFGAEAEIPLSTRVQVMPAARLYWHRDTDADNFGALALGSTTIRATVSLQWSSRR